MHVHESQPQTLVNPLVYKAKLKDNEETKINDRPLIFSLNSIMNVASKVAKGQKAS